MRVTTAILISFAATVSAQELCDSSVSDPIVATLDNSALFSNCATAEIRVQTRVSSLFDVLQFTAKDLTIFCRASGCLSPVRDLVASIPPNCLIKYHGSNHNLSKEVTAIHDECMESNTAARKAAEDDMARYFLDI
ncbi:elicitin [Phytophthora sojae]|uniref:Elicitin n=2 Tax=Phytophthora sojae TaxID=67593 RepID=G4Z429_PHYSP|nr:elicitin [Phytophthora sojae]ABB56006.1 elicitin-like protein SOL11E [Phytophthora sojae]EGZ22223.1 elicitin [Phytophthora sojae]|eukprot:XP_009524940.1 elicitin [Phytophthora sojae]